MQPWPLVKKNKSLVLFQAISFTSKLNCSSARILCVRVSMNVTISSLLPTAIVFPSGDQVILIFSPFVLIVVEHLPTRTSQMRTVLSPLAVLNRSGNVACQHNWSTEPVCPRYVLSFAWKQQSNWSTIRRQKHVDRSQWHCLSYQTISIEREYCHRFIKWTWGQSSPITIPSNGMNLFNMNKNQILVKICHNT